MLKMIQMTQKALTSQMMMSSCHPWVLPTVNEVWIPIHWGGRMSSRQRPRPLLLRIVRTQSRSFKREELHRLDLLEQMAMDCIWFYMPMTSIRRLK